LAERLREALASLDARQAEVVTRVCMDGFSYKQIAEQLGVSGDRFTAAAGLSKLG
jgi:DNA-directed RNA polymerase specialized sigma24 family protein